MNKTFFTPGPSQLYPTVPSHLEAALEAQIGSVSHRSPAFMEIFEECQSHLRKLLEIPDDYRIFFFSSATEIWERLLQSFPGKPFFFVNGNFSARFKEFADRMGRDTSSVVAEFGEGFAMGQVQVPEGTAFCGMIGNETSSGVQIPFEDYYAFAEQHPELLCFVDMVSAWPAARLDVSRLDGAYFSVQKGFGLPAGLGVLVVSPRSLERVQEAVAKGEFRGLYHSLPDLEAKAAKHQTPATPNVLGLYLLGKVAWDMLARGPELIDCAQAKRKKLYAFFEGHGKWQPLVDIPRWRSETVVVLETPDEAEQIVAALEEKGFVVGTGYGERKRDQIRIANFPATSEADVDRLLEAFASLE